jgi:hypothetical protein
MLRRLFTVLSALSLLLCVAAAVLWVRSYWMSDMFMYSWPKSAVFIEHGGGQFRFEHTRVVDPNWTNRPSGFRHRTDKVDGPLEAGMMMPASWQHFRGYGFWLVTGERW